MSAWRTHIRNDSTPYPSWSATRVTMPCSVPVSARSVRTIRTATAFSCSVCRRVVGFPADCSWVPSPDATCLPDYDPT